MWHTKFDSDQFRHLGDARIHTHTHTLCVIYIYSRLRLIGSLSKNSINSLRLIGSKCSGTKVTRLSGADCIEIPGIPIWYKFTLV